MLRYSVDLGYWCLVPPRRRTRRLPLCSDDASEALSLQCSYRMALVTPGPMYQCLHRRLLLMAYSADRESER
jgi:hypothetical protein